MLGNDVLHQHIAAGNGCCDHVCSCLNLVRNDGILCAVEFFHPFDTDDICTSAFDIGTHHVQIVCSIYHMGFFCCVFDGCHAFCHGSSQHDVDGSTYTYLVHINGCTHQSVCISTNHAVAFFHCCTQCTEAFQMQVNGSNAKVAAAGQRNFRFFVSGKHSSQEIIRSSDLLYFFKSGTMGCSLITVDFQCMPIIQIGACATQFFDGVTEIVHILNAGQVFQYTDALCHDSCGNHCNSRVFGTADVDFPYKTFTSLYNQFIHKQHSSFQIIRQRTF